MKASRLRKISRHHLFFTRAAALRASICLGTFALAASIVSAAPKVILISLDGATPRLVDQFSASGALPPDQGLRLLEAQGVKAFRNTTILPSLTAGGHIAIATGTTAANTDVVGNSFRLQASPFSAGTISGFGAPIGGYSIDGPAETMSPTAEPLWLALRASGRVVATATWPGSDGIDVRVPGTNTIVQSAAKRTVDYTIPFGAATAPFQRGFNFTSSNFTSAPAAATVSALTAAGHPSFNQRQANLETFTSGGVSYDIKAVALDTTNDGVANYDTIVLFNQAQGIQQPGTFSLPSTGPAYIAPSANISALFYLEGHANKAGVRYFVTQLQPDLSAVRIARTSATFLPRNNSPSVPQVLADVDDINNNVGFWQPQADFRIPERIDASPSTFTAFPDAELEAIYVDLVKNFVQYQTNVGLRAITRFPNADLVMIYIEQPDGSEHQFLLTDPRQATDPRNPNSIGASQDQAKKTRYNGYVQTAYVTANNAVQQVINAVGVNANGRPNSNIFVVSDHGFDPFHTEVSLNALLAAAGVNTANLRIVTSGPAANIYINLAGRQPGGTQTRQQYLDLQAQVASALRNYADNNPNYTLGAGSVPVFDLVFSRPTPADINDPSFGRTTTENLAQDSGDVSAVLKVGYNFDGRQTPAVTRLGDTSSSVLSVPNFYGAHGYDPTIANMSAIFYAAGPDITPGGRIDALSNIDVAPTIEAILGVPPARTVRGLTYDLAAQPPRPITPISEPPSAQPVPAATPHRGDTIPEPPPGLAPLSGETLNELPVAGATADATPRAGATSVAPAPRHPRRLPRSARRGH